MEIKFVPIQDKRERLLWLDVGRCIAILSITVAHAVHRSLNVQQHVREMRTDGLISGLTDWGLVLRMALYFFSRLGVPLFFMMTGTLILSKSFNSFDDVKRFYRNNWIKLLITTEIWLAIMFFVIISAPFTWDYPTITGIPDGIGWFIRTLLFDSHFTYGNLWYMRDILLIYPVLPLIAVAIRQATTRVVAAPLLAVTVLGFVVPFVNEVGTGFGQSDLVTVSLNKANVFSVYMVYIIIGYMLSKGLLKKVADKWIGLAVVLSFLLSVYYLLWYAETRWYYNIAYEHLLTLISALFLFEAIRRFGGKLKKLQRPIGYIANISFAIYFMHIVIMEHLRYGLFDNQPLAPDQELLGFLFLEGVSVGASILVVLLLSKIRWIRKYVFMMK